MIITSQCVWNSLKVFTSQKNVFIWVKWEIKWCFMPQSKYQGRIGKHLLMWFHIGVLYWTFYKDKVKQYNVLYDLLWIYIMIKLMYAVFNRWTIKIVYIIFNQKYTCIPSVIYAEPAAWYCSFQYPVQGLKVSLVLEEQIMVSTWIYHKTDTFYFEYFTDISTMK